MRRFSEMVADVIDDMLAADFEDGFAFDGQIPSEMPGADTAFRELTRTTATLPYDWSVDEDTIFSRGSRDAGPIPGWERRHARAATVAAATRVPRRRPGQVPTSCAPCSAPIHTVDGGSTSCR
jgi:hypothetical protein